MRWCLLLWSISLFAQSGSQTGLLTGTVTGPDGVVVPDAVIQAGPAKAVSSAKGRYELRLAPGEYDIAVSVPCCQWGGTKLPKVRVAAGPPQKVDIKLPWGANLGAEGDDPLLLLNELRDRNAVPKGPAPRAQNGRPDLSGVWIPAYNPEGPPPPLQPWAAKLFAERAATNWKDYPGAYCQPANAASITRFFPFKIVQTPKLMVFLHESDTPGVRQVFLDGRGHPDVEKFGPTWQGHSIGHWQGTRAKKNEVLAIETVNFNDRSWLSLTGIPHSEKLRVLERIRRIDKGRLEIDITMEDPGAFTAPWHRVFEATLAPEGEELLEWICSENNKDTAHYR